MDDILIWGENLQELEERINVISQRCEKLNVILSKKKFIIGTSIPFAGYVVSDKGVHPDPHRVESIRKFPTPVDVTGVKSFLGMANQLSFFIPDYAHNSRHLRELTGKGKVFRWLPEHQSEFERMKEILSETLLTHHFDPSLPVSLLTDASRQHGLGYALCQTLPTGQLVIITCGSKSLTPTQQRYATIELECLAIMWAMNKCDFYLKGLPKFSVLTDHKPLVGIFQKTLYDLSNPRLRRMREKMSGYTFSVEWVAGKTHFIADALSRALLFIPEEEPDMVVDTASLHWQLLMTLHSRSSNSTLTRTTFSAQMTLWVRQPGRP